MSTELAAPLPALTPAAPPLAGRLGLNVPRDWWPRPARLKALEAAGFRWLQVHAPPCEVLADPGLAAHHARALRRLLDGGSLGLVVHAPDELAAGEDDAGDALDGLVSYCELARPSFVVYHGAVLPAAVPPARVRAEVRALRRLTRGLAACDTTLAVENTAPTYPGAARRGHDPNCIAELVATVGERGIGMCLDLGHAHLFATARERALEQVIASCLPRTVLFHVHDNLGAERRRAGAERHVPLRLDLHLPPGAGTLPWRALAGSLRAHAAPLLLEIHPSHRPDAMTLADLTEGLLQRKQH